MRVWELVKTWLGAIVLVGAMLFAVVRVVHTQLTYEAPDVTTIRITHWQLEAGFRDALQDLIDEYEQQTFERTGQKVRVLQMPVSERGYGQFINTSLIGGTAPDILERGYSAVATSPSYVARFFTPLRQYILEPNPYNAGTALADVPWKDTIFDGMYGGYVPELLDYYDIPFSMFTVRMYYNRDLFRQATGSAQPPQEYQEFLADCQAIQAYARRTGQPVVPIAGSKYQASVLSGRYGLPFMLDVTRRCDFNLDGAVGPIESYLAYREGRFKFDEPAFLLRWRCMAELASNFQLGWQAALRDDAVFMFVQQRAAMFASGSWDTSSLLRQVGDRFEVGIFDFPLPIDHPEYGQYIKGPVSEGSIKSSVPWGINLRSPHKDLCIDFLRFCTTPARNERFNTSIPWLPVVRGSRVSERLIPFKPRMEGFAFGFSYAGISTSVALIAGGNRGLLFMGRMSPQEYADRLIEVIDRSGADGFREMFGKEQRARRDTERILVSQMIKDFYRPLPASGAFPVGVQQLASSLQERAYLDAASRARFAALTATPETVNR